MGLLLLQQLPLVLHLRLLLLLLLWFVASEPAGYLGDRLWCPRLFLHCCYLGTGDSHQHKGAPMGAPFPSSLDVRCPLPSDLTEALRQLQPLAVPSSF